MTTPPRVPAPDTPLPDDQAKFDFVVAHMRRQGRRSANRKGDCLYRGPGGTACAIGCLIPDGLYRQRMEGLSALDLSERYPDLAPFLPDREIAGDWQAGLHDLMDGDFDPEVFEERARALARYQGLVYTPPANHPTGD